MKIISFFIYLILILKLDSVKAQQWPNEPAGSTVVFDCPFSGDVCGMTNIWNTLPFKSFPSAGQLSPSSALAIEMSPGQSQGNGEWTRYFNPPVRELYLGFWWSTNADFVGSGNNSNKMIMIKNAVDDNSLIDWLGTPGSGPRQIVFVGQMGYSNCGKPNTSGMCYPVDGTGYFIPNTANASRASIAPGSGWHRIEYWERASSTASSNDGAFKIWVDGYLTSDFTQINLHPSGVQEVHLNAGWDGSGPFAGRDLTKLWGHYYDHMHISTCAGCVMGTGTTPPASIKKPTNLRIL